MAILRYFYEELQELPVIATGSLLEFALEAPAFSLPVGRIEFYYMGPFSFEEALEALEQRHALELIRGFSPGTTIPDAFHQQLNRLARLYVLTGGMPESLATYKETGSLRETERVKADILETFILDFNTYKGKADTDLLRHVFQSLPGHIGKKIVYSRIHPHRRSRDISAALHQLCLARVISLVCHSSGNGVPLSAEKKDHVFKPLFLDTGLLLSQFNLNPSLIEIEPDLNLINQGTLAEHFIGQQLLSMAEVYREPELFYWVREKKASSSEIDYLTAAPDGRIVPVEVKSGKTGSLRSLQMFVAEKESSLALRFNSDKPSVYREKRKTPKGEVDYMLLSLPHYLVQQSGRVISELALKRGHSGH